jgi:SpoVK/Ycf46/Vps4 family AAA+-type ATPase
MKDNYKRKIEEMMDLPLSNTIEKKYKSNTIINGMIYFNREIKDIDDLIFLGSQYRPGKKYNINVEKLYKLIPVLTKLKKVIGMETVKKTIVNQIIYFIQDFQDKNSDMLHTVIQGPPGVGKTMLGEIIGEIYYRLDIIESPSKTSYKSKSSRCCSATSATSDDDKSDSKSESEFKFTIAKRSDLIGKYLGQTAAKTQEVINKSLGGVLFIDEAYSLGNPEGRDSYSKECIDTLNQNLTEKKNQLLVIIAGYKNALDDCFFAYNEGLRRRFPFVYTIEKYSPLEMSDILKKMIENLGQDWSLDIDQKVLVQYFEKNIDLFPNSAGDIETLVFSIKIEHSKRVFCQEPGSKLRKKITKTDIDNALETYKINKEKKEKKDEIPQHLQHLYV